MHALAVAHQGAQMIPVFGDGLAVVLTEFLARSNQDLFVVVQADIKPATFKAPQELQRRQWNGKTTSEDDKLRRGSSRH